jgi:plasmid stability protein
MVMAAIVVRNVPEETSRALKVRARQHGRSTEAEIRVILEDAVRPADRARLGSELAALGRRFGGVELDITRDRTVVDPASFE